MSKIIGIDLGTTNSAVAVLKAAKRKLLQTQKVTAQLLRSFHSKTVKFKWAK